MLNGADELTNTENSSRSSDQNKSADIYGDENSLLVCMPKVLQEALGFTAVKYDSVYNNKTVANLRTSYDKLWLLSTNEIWSTEQHTEYYNTHPLEGTQYPYFVHKSEIGLVQDSSNSQNGTRGYFVSDQIGTTENAENRWWLRSLRTTGPYVQGVYGEGANYYYSANNTLMVAPCFSLSRSSTIDDPIKDPSKKGERFIIYNEKYHRVTFSKRSSLDDTGLAGATFRLYGKSNYDRDVDLTATSNENGTVQFEKIESGVYTLVETSAPEGYALDSTPHAVVVYRNGDIEIKGLSFDSSSGLYKWTNVKKRDKEIVVVKKWVDELTNDERPLPAITLTTEVPRGRVRYYTVRYHASNADQTGTFGSGDVNEVRYESVTSRTDTGSQLTAISHSNNITDEGVRTGSYAAQTTLDTVQIEGAAKLQVDVWFNLYNNSNYGYLSIYDGTMTPSPSNASTANVSNGRLYGNTAPFREKPADDNAQRHKTYIVNGDTVQFLFYSNIARDYYGYWAEIKALNSDETPYTYSWNTTFTEITGSYERPNVALEGYGFAGWYTDDTNQTTEFEMTGENSSSTGRVPIGDLSTVETGGDGVVDVYAKYDIVSLMQGIFFNAKLKTIANNTNKEYTQDDQKVEAIKWSSYEPTAENRTEDHIVSVATSPYPVYAWFDDSNGTGTIYLWCATNTVFTPPTFSYAFSNFRQLQDISGLANLNTSRTTALDHAFEQCQKLENLNGLQNWDVSKVTTMQSMLASCLALTTLGNPNSSIASERGISDWRDRLDSLTSMYGMFSSCQNLAEVNALKDWDVSNVTRMEYMLSSNIKLTDISGLSQWNTGRVTSLASTFSGCSSLSDISPLSGWNTSSVTSLNSTFSGCKSLVNLNDISEWNTVKVTSLQAMLQNCTGLESLGDPTSTDNKGLSNWNTEKVTNMSSMFYNCSGLTNVDGLARWNTGSVSNMKDMFSACSGLINLNGLISWETKNVTKMDGMFYGCHNLTNISGLENWNTESATTMSSMFTQCSSLTDSSALNSWADKLDHCTSFNYMFQYTSTHPDWSAVYPNGTWDGNGTFNKN